VLLEQNNYLENINENPQKTKFVIWSLFMNLSKMHLSIVWIFLFLPQIAWSGAAYDSVEELDQAIHKAEQAAVLSSSCMPDITKCDDLREQYVKTMFSLFFDREQSDVMTEIQRQKIINMPSLAIAKSGGIIGSNTGAVLVSHHKVGGFYGAPPPLTMDLEGTHVIFYWEFLGSAFQYKLQIGSQVGGNDLYDSDLLDGYYSVLNGYYTSVENLPDDGRKLYIRVSTKVNNNWITNDFIHNAYGSNNSSNAVTINCNAVTEISAVECQSLLELYNNTSGSNWKNNEGWNKNNTPCSWYGVTCKNGGVTQIYLRNNQLTGSLVDFSGFPNLIWFDLISNQLIGSIPNFSKLPQLETLSLHDNQLTGTIPNFRSSPKLKNIWFSNNQLTGTIPNFSWLPNLEGLWLYVNQLTGAIPDFSGLPLKYLGLKHNPICKRTDINYAAWNLELAYWDNNTSWQQQLNTFSDCPISNQTTNQPDNALSLFEESKLYEKQGLYTKALETIEKALIIEPNNDTYLAYASHYARYAGQDEKGLRYGINAININKNIGWYYVTTALSAYNLGKMEIAKKYADSALKFGLNALGQANYDAMLTVMNANSVTTTPTTEVTEITTFEKKSNIIFDLVEKDYAQYFFPATGTQVSGSGNEIQYSRIYNNEYQAGLRTKENNLWYKFYGEWHRFGTLEEANQQLCKNKCWTVENQPTNQLQKSIHVLEIVNPQTNLGAITHDLDGSFTAYYGLKDKNGNLLSIDKVTFFDQNTQQWMSVHLDLFYFPNKITFSSGEKINIKKLSDQQINVKLINPQGTEIASKDISLQNQTDRSNTRSSQTISDIQENIAKTPNVVSLCRKREKTIKIRYIPDSFITGLSKLLEVFDIVNTIKSLVTKPTLKNIAQTALDQSRSAIANSVSNNGNTIVQTMDSAASVVSACVAGGVGCAIQVVNNIGIPLLRKANNGEIEVGEINQCSDAEKMDGYLYADCAGRIINAEGDKECRIDYGGQIDIGIFYYNPYPYKGFIEFLELGGQGTIPQQFEQKIPSNTSGYLKFSAKHQVLYDPERWRCHTTETLPGEGEIGEDPGSLYGLSMEIPEVPGGDFMPNGKIIFSQNYPIELSIITEGNGKGYVGGTAIPCWYYFEK
jgi:tetratricopeptide (TPR) repeat protein